MCCQVEHANCFLRLSTIHSSPCFSALPGQATAPLAWLAALSLVSSIHFPHSSLRDLSETSLPKEIYGQVTTILRVKSRCLIPCTSWVLPLSPTSFFPTPPTSWPLLFSLPGNLHPLPPLLSLGIAPWWIGYVLMDPATQSPHSNHSGSSP